MTTDELIDLGHKAGTLFITQFGVASVTVEWLENFAGLVANAEREACAKVCYDKANETFSGHCQVWGDYFARAIRARGNT